MIFGRACSIRAAEDVTAGGTIADGVRSMVNMVNTAAGRADTHTATRKVTIAPSSSLGARS